MQKILKIFLAVILTGVLGYLLFLHRADVRKSVTERDSVAYWAAAQLLVGHQNPYDYAEVLRREEAQGYSEARPLVLRTPPWSLFMVVPLGWSTPFGAWAIWIGILFGCLILGLRLIRKLYTPPQMPPNLFSILAYTFAPVPACLVSGQMGLVLMLGIILFLWWEKEHPYLAGVALILPFAKPHLLTLFWVVLLLWVVARRKQKIAAGFCSALAGATLLALYFDPQVFTHYREMIQVAAIQREFIPALSGVLRLLFFRRFFWMQFAPLGIGLAWGLQYLRRNWKVWDWRVHGPALLIVSVLTTPYEWLSDETVLLPAVLQAAALVFTVRAPLKVLPKIVLIGFACLNVLLLLILRFKIPFSTGIYFWSSLVWFGWYFYARRIHRKAASADAPALVNMSP